MILIQKLLDKCHDTDTLTYDFLQKLRIKSGAESESKLL